MCIFNSFIDFFSYKNKKNQPIILSLETGVPKYKTNQSDALYYLLSNYKNKNNITYQTIVKNIYKNSHIETRYLGIPDFRGCDGAPVECSMENMENEIRYKCEEDIINDIEPVEEIEKYKTKGKKVFEDYEDDFDDRNYNYSDDDYNVYSDFEAR